MNEQTPSPATLEQVRQQIDEIDAALLDLLSRRFAASHKVKAIKEANGQATSSPMRPAREAIVLRRLIAARSSQLPVELLVRVWREIMAGSTLVQADATVHAARPTLAIAAWRDQIRSHFGQIPLVEHPTDAQALLTAADTKAAVAVVPVDRDWPAWAITQNNKPLSVVATLPFITRKDQPDLFVAGEPFEEPTGQDETLLHTSGRLPREFELAPLWELELATGDWLTSLPGYLSASQPPLVGLKQRNDELALRVLGRYASPIKIDT